ncbi:hypothetical protein FHG87_008880 [Trinorchestia longiramus]|nr:hypothetical protein FHG87_008880 [Trinorchestia longiramus]
MNTNSLQQHVNEPTRGNNNLDLVMTTTDLSINGLEVTDKIGDHQMIDFSLEVQDPNTRTQHKQVLDYKRANFELMKYQGSKLIDLMNTNSLQQHGNEPTRGNNILDLVMTTTDLSINGLEVTDKIGDHQMIDFLLEVQDPNTRTQHKQVLDYKRANFELMKEELGSYNYEVLMNNKNAEECYMILKDKTATATDHHIPRKRIRPN